MKKYKALRILPPRPKTRINTGVGSQNSDTPVKVLEILQIMRTKTIEYRQPRICSCNNNLSQEWFVEFYWRKPNQVKMKRERVYRGIGMEMDYHSRMNRALILQDNIKARLQSGWDPSIEKYERPDTHKPQLIETALNNVLLNKQRTVKKNSYETINQNLQAFIKYMNAVNANLHPKLVQRSHIVAFLNYLLSKGISNKTWNSYLINISAAFNTLVRDQVIDENPCVGIKKLPTLTKNHIPYTEAELLKIKQYFNEEDPYLGLFCRFIVYCFLRINEIRMLQVKHFDLINHRIYVPAEIIKTNETQVIHIPAVFKPDIDALQLHLYLPNDYIFTPQKTPGIRFTGENYFRKRFKKLKKKFGFDEHHSMYGLRHTYVCDLVRNGLSDTEMMKLTRHKTFDAYEKYKRHLMTEKPKDVSDLYTVKL